MRKSFAYRILDQRFSNSF